MLIIAVFYFPLNFHNPVLWRVQTNRNFTADKDTLTKDEQETGSTISSTEFHIRNEQVCSQLHYKAPCSGSLDDFSSHTIAPKHKHYSGSWDSNCSGPQQASSIPWTPRKTKMWDSEVTTNQWQIHSDFRGWDLTSGYLPFVTHTLPAIKHHYTSKPAHALSVSFHITF